MLSETHSPALTKALDSAPGSQDENASPIREARREALARQFETMMQGKLDAAKIEAALEVLKLDLHLFIAEAKVASAIFYLHFEIAGKYKKFTGHAGGLSSPGGGLYEGDVYSVFNDFTTLILETRNFSFTITTPSLIVWFFDSYSNLLGYYIGAGGSSILGTGGGSGKWA